MTLEGIFTIENLYFRVEMENANGALFVDLESTDEPVNPECELGVFPFITDEHLSPDLRLVLKHLSAIKEMENQLEMNWEYRVTTIVEKAFAAGWEARGSEKVQQLLDSMKTP